jgi:hypothetical protein
MMKKEEVIVSLLLIILFGLIGWVVRASYLAIVELGKNGFDRRKGV